MALSSAVPLTEATLTELAPRIVEHVGGGYPAAALDRLWRDFTANLHIKEWTAACAALGFDEQVKDPSKQRRLSDLAVFYERSGWRNMHRWCEIAFEHSATNYAALGQARDLFRMDLTQSDDAKTFDFSLTHWERENKKEWVDRVDLQIDHHLQLLWIPQGR